MDSGKPVYTNKHKADFLKLRLLSDPYHLASLGLLPLHLVLHAYCSPSVPVTVSDSPDATGGAINYITLYEQRHMKPGTPAHSTTDSLGRTSLAEVP